MTFEFMRSDTKECCMNIIKERIQHFGAHILAMGIMASNI